MAITLQLKRGNTAENNGFIGEEGELTFDTDKSDIRIHDGETAGGRTIFPPFIECTTSADEPAKTVSAPGFRYISGSLIVIDFVHGNELDSTPVTLNINALGALPILSGETSVVEMGAHTCLMVVYTPSAFRVVGLPMNNPVVMGSVTTDEITLRGIDWTAPQSTQPDDPTTDEPNDPADDNSESGSNP